MSLACLRVTVCMSVPACHCLHVTACVSLPVCGGLQELRPKVVVSQQCLEPVMAAVKQRLAAQAALQKQINQLGRPTCASEWWNYFTEGS